MSSTCRHLISTAFKVAHFVSYEHDVLLMKGETVQLSIHYKLVESETSLGQINKEFCNIISYKPVIMTR